MTEPLTPSLAPAAVDVVVDGAIAHVTLNRPELHNAISHAMLDLFRSTLDDLRRRGDVKVVVLAGAGRSFCSGFELSTSSDAISAVALDAEADQRRVAGYLEAIDDMLSSPLIIVGAVHGHCMGIGVLLAAACDVLVVEADARFGMPLVPIGAAFVSAYLGTVVGPRRAKRMSLVPGGSIDGTTAHEWGLSTDLVAHGEARSAAADLAGKIARMPASVLRLEKRAMARVSDAGTRAALAVAADIDAIAHASSDVHDLKATIQRVGLKAAVAEFGS